MTPLEIIEAGYQARRRGDLDAVLALCADAIVFTCNVDPDRVDSGTTLVGRAQIRRHLETVESIWQPIATALGPIKVIDAGTAALRSTDLRCIITFVLRHRGTGHTLEGMKTHEWRVRDGKITSLRETLDRAFIKAFVAMSEEPAEPTRSTPVTTPAAAPTPPLTPNPSD